MTFLEMCQRLRQEAGAAGTGPANVAGQSGEGARLVGWVATSWEEIQREQYWKFDWAQGAVRLNTLDTMFSLPADLDVWNPDSLKFQGRPIHVVAWSDLEKQSANAFHQVAISPDQVLHLNAAAEAEKDLTFEYWRTPQMLSGNGDVPRMPTRFHMLIVWRALVHYALYENAPEVLQRARLMSAQLENDLQHSQLPKVETGPALA